MNKEVLEILKTGTKREIRTLFLFNKDTDSEHIRQKLNIWTRYFFPDYFLEKGTKRAIPDAPFHQIMDERNIGIYIGKESSFLNIAFREASKTTRTKLFIAFAIANDSGHYRKYIKVLS